MDGCRSRLASLALTRWSTLPTFPLIRLPHWFLSAGSCCLPNLVRATSNFTLNQNTAHLPPSKPRTVVSTFGWFSPAVNSHNRGFHLLQRLQRYGVPCAASNRLCLLPSTTTNGAGISPQRKWTYSPPRLRPQTEFTDVQHGFYARPRLRPWSIVCFANSFASLSRFGLQRRGHRRTAKSVCQHFDSDACTPLHVVSSGS